MKTRVTIVMAVFNQLSLTRACLQSLTGTTETFALVVVDNGSTDDTHEFLGRFPYSFPLRVIRNDRNESVIVSFNRGWPHAETEFVCFLHNDTEMITPDWLARLLAPFVRPDVGMTGLFGVKRLRRNSRFVGRTIVHSLAEGPTVRAPWEEVAVIDGVCLCMRRELLASLGGVDEGYGFYHGWDKDLSFAVRERGLRCLVVDAPFLHHGGGTRVQAFARDPERERRDLALRGVAIDRLLDKWGHRLPCDVRPLGERASDWLRTKLTRAGRGVRVGRR